MSHKKQKGFTLVELLVSMGLFSIVMMISIGTLLSIVDANRKARSLIAVTTEMNFLFDSMMRTIRTGYEYRCGIAGSDCPNGDLVLNLKNKDGDPVQYSFNQGLGTIERTIDGSRDRLTSPIVRINKMSFIVTGTAVEGDEEQPTVTVMVQAAAGVDAETSTRFNLQATVTQRVLDL